MVLTGLCCGDSIESAAQTAPIVVINEIMSNPHNGSLQPHQGYNWVELFNAGADTVNLGNWAISNRDGQAKAILPSWDFPDSAYCVVYFTTGVDDNNFNDGRGHYFAGDIVAFNPLMDEVALYMGAPADTSILDIFTWSADSTFTGGQAHNWAVAAGIWNYGNYFATEPYDPPEIAMPVIPGQSIGRDKNSTDTNLPADWAIHGGRDARGLSPGYRNYHPFVWPPTEPIPPQPPKKWTVMLYIYPGVAGDHSLDKFFKDNLEEMEQVGSNVDINIVVQYFEESRQASRLYMKLHTNPGLGSMRDFLGPRNPGDPAELTGFITWAMNNFSADHYALIVGGHGGGWNGTLFGGLNDRLTMPDFHDALAPITPKFDALFFYSCHMAAVEVARQVADHAQYMIASENVTWIVFPFDIFLADLRDNAALWSAQTFSIELARTFDARLDTLKYYTRTTSVVDLAGFKANLMPAIDAFAKELILGVDDYKGHNDPTDNVQIKIKNARNPVWNYFNGNFVDLYDLADRIENEAGIAPYNTRAAPIKNRLALGAGVVISNHSIMPRVHGLTIYFPMYQTKVAVGNSYDDPISSGSDVEYRKYSFDPDDCNPPDQDVCDNTLVKNHPIDPTGPNFLFVEQNQWDEFLHRYYEPVADAYVDKFIGLIGEPFEFMAIGSSDSDGNTTAYYWDMDAETDQLPTEDCTVADDWDKDCVDEADDDKDREGDTIIQAFDTCGLKKINLTVWDDHHLQGFVNGYDHTGHYESDQDPVEVVVLCPGQGSTGINLPDDWAPNDGSPMSDLNPVYPDIWSVPFNMAANISPPGLPINTPGDSICFNVYLQGGAVLTGPPRVRYSLKANPVFDPYRSSGLANEGWVLSDSSRTADGVPVPNQWFFDLPDSGFFYPGDVIHFFLEATEDQGGVIRTVHLPSDTTGFATFPGFAGFSSLRYPGKYTVRALPSVFSLVPGDQPEILLWNDQGYGSGLTTWERTLANLGYIQGVDYDLFTTRAPGRGLGNGLGGRATAANLNGYRTILYTSGKESALTITPPIPIGDPGDDVGVLDAWLQTGNRNLFICGDHVISDMGYYGGTPAAFVNEHVSVIGLSNDIHDVLGYSNAFLVKPVLGAPVLNINEWIVGLDYPENNTIDTYQVFGSAQVLAEYSNGFGLAAATLYVNALLMNTTISLPYDLTRVVTSGGSGAPVSGRAQLLSDVLIYFGHFPSGTFSDLSPGAPGELTVRSWPNPFNPQTRILYHMPRQGRMTVKIFNVRGKLVRTLLDEVVGAGPRELIWKGTDERDREVASGVYFYRLEALGQTRIGKLALVK